MKQALKKLQTESKASLKMSDKCNVCGKSEPIKFHISENAIQGDNEGVACCTHKCAITELQRLKLMDKGAFVKIN